MNTKKVKYLVVAVLLSAIVICVGARKSSEGGSTGIIHFVGNIVIGGCYAGQDKEKVKLECNEPELEQRIESVVYETIAPNLKIAKVTYL